MAAPTMKTFGTGPTRAPAESETLRVGIAKVHGCFELKQCLVGKLHDAGHRVIDFRDDQSQPGNDYPDFVVPLARAVSSGDAAFSAAICGSSNGALIAANKVPGFRACLIHETISAHQGVEDDNINNICLGGLLDAHANAWELLHTFLAARFGGAERHRRDLEKGAELDEILLKEMP